VKLDIQELWIKYLANKYMPYEIIEKALLTRK
jgi:hypothetical protein